MRATKALLKMTLIGLSCGNVWAQDAASPKPAPHAYHLTYILTEKDGAKRVGVQRYTMSITDDNQNVDFRIDSKVPVEVGSGNEAKTIDLEVGLNLHARLRAFSNGLEISSFVQRTDFVDSTVSSLRQPVIRNTDLANTTLLTPGRPVMLGSLDEPGSTDHLDVEVSLEPVQ